MKIEILYTTEELKKEYWVSIPHYEKLYEVSNLGRIRTAEGKTTYTKRHGYRVWQQRIMKPKYCAATKNSKRYDARVDLWKNGQHKTFLLARLIIAAFDKKYDLFDKMTVNHIDGNSLNNRITNLEWCTRKQNILKGFETGAYHYPKIKITNKQSGEIKIFPSMSQASIYLGFNCKYLSEQFRLGKTESLKYKWEKID